MRFFSVGGCTALAVLVAAWGLAAPAQGREMVKDSMGCFDRSTFERLDRLLYAGERDSFATIGDEKIAASECLKLMRGKTVTIEDVAGRLACARLDPRIDCVWTWRDVIGN